MTSLFCRVVVQTSWVVWAFASTGFTMSPACVGQLSWQAADHNAFIRQIGSSPEDDITRLVYADYLEENGEGERAAYIRQQIAAARDGRPSPSRKNERWIPSELRDLGFDVRWSRGFIEGVIVGIHHFGTPEGRRKIRALADILPHIPTIKTLVFTREFGPSARATEALFLRRARRPFPLLRTITRVEIQTNFMRRDFRLADYLLQMNPVLKQVLFWHFTPLIQPSLVERTPRDRYRVVTGSLFPFSRDANLDRVENLEIALPSSAPPAQVGWPIPLMSGLSQITFGFTRSQPVLESWLERSDIAKVRALTITNPSLMMNTRFQEIPFSHLTNLTVRWNTECRYKPFALASALTSWSRFSRLTELELPTQFNEKSRAHIETMRTRLNPTLRVNYR